MLYIFSFRRIILKLRTEIQNRHTIRFLLPIVYRMVKMPISDFLVNMLWLLYLLQLFFCSDIFFCKVVSDSHHSTPHHFDHHSGLRNRTHLSTEYSLPRFHPRLYNPTRINLGWIINADAKFIADYGHELSAIECYCAMYQIHFYLESILIDTTDHRDYQIVKLKNVMKYLKYHDWLFVTDADVMVLNYTQSIYDYIDERYDIIFHERSDYANHLEIEAGNYFVKNSLKGIEFLQKWHGFSFQPGGSGLNLDNGDLQELLQQFIRNDYNSRPCFSIRTISWEAYRERFLPCAMKEINEYKIQKFSSNPYYYFFPSPYEYVKILRAFMGFYHRLNYQNSISCTPYDTTCHFYYGDFLGHGKRLGLYLDSAFIKCDLDRMIALNITGRGNEEILMPPLSRWYDYSKCQYLAKEVYFHPLLACPSYTNESKGC
jgi:hypothetical protein